MAEIIGFPVRAHGRTASSRGYKSGRSSVLGIPVSRSIGKTNSAGTPLFDRESQYQTCDCVVPIRSAKRFWPPADSHARRSASFDMPPHYPNLGEIQQKNLCATRNLVFGTGSSMRPVDKKAFGNRVKARRERLGLSQTALADSAGMKQQSIVNIEQGTVERPRRLRELAQFLLTTEEWLLWKEGPEDAGTDELAEIIMLLQRTPADRRRTALRLLRNWVTAGEKSA